MEKKQQQQQGGSTLAGHKLELELVQAHVGEYSGI
jgi:hypothetical protein